MWQKGQSGNPRGRKPIEPTITGLLRDRVDPEEFVTKLFDLAYNPTYTPDLRLRAMTVIIGYIDGLPAQKIQQQIEEVRKPQVIISLPDNNRARTIDEPRPGDT